MSTEYRAKLFSIVHGALFVDAGNIWLWNDDPDKPGGKFSKDFLSEMAVGTGAGLRFDLSVLVLRFDLAFPLRKPYLPESERWVSKTHLAANTGVRNLVFSCSWISFKLFDRQICNILTIGHSISRSRRFRISMICFKTLNFSSLYLFSALSCLISFEVNVFCK